MLTEVREKSAIHRWHFHLFLYILFASPSSFSPARVIYYTPVIPTLIPSLHLPNTFSQPRAFYTPVNPVPSYLPLRIHSHLFFFFYPARALLYTCSSLPFLFNQPLTCPTHHLRSHRSKPCIMKFLSSMYSLLYCEAEETEEKRNIKPRPQIMFTSGFGATSSWKVSFISNKTRHCNHTHR